MKSSICEICKNTFSARSDRVKKGLGRFCSKKCFDVEQVNRRRAFWGRKDLARKYRIGGRYCARWYDENGKTCSTSYGRWWWETNVGQIPQGMVVLHKDNNPMNISSDNFVLGTKKESTDRGKASLRADKKRWNEYIKNIRKRSLGRKMSNESKMKMSNSKKGKKLSMAHRNSLSSALIKTWKRGVYDSHKGKNNPNWKENKQRHPKEFSKELREFVRQRDSYACQICGRDVSRLKKRGIVHHIDGVKTNNDSSNLILFCIPCHTRVHFAKGNTSPGIMAFREKLLE